MRKIARRGNVELPDAIKQSCCEFCGSLFVVENCLVRLQRRSRTKRLKKKKGIISPKTNPESSERRVNRSPRAKTDRQTSKGRNHIVKTCNVCGKRSVSEGFERVRARCSVKADDSLVFRTPTGPASLPSTPLSGSSVEQTRSEKKRHRSRMSTASKLRNILEVEKKRKSSSSPATPNIQDFLSSLWPVLAKTIYQTHWPYFGCGGRGVVPSPRPVILSPALSLPPATSTKWCPCHFSRHRLRPPATQATIYQNKIKCCRDHSNFEHYLAQKNWPTPPTSQIARRETTVSADYPPTSTLLRLHFTWGKGVGENSQHALLQKAIFTKIYKSTFSTFCKNLSQVSVGEGGIHLSSLNQLI